MSPRDKSFVVILASSVVGIGVASFFLYQWFWAPLQDYNARIKDLERETELLQDEWTQFLRGKKRLEVARLKSLPIKQEQATTEYLPYLETTLRDAGLVVSQVTPGNAVKVKAPASVPEVKEVDHRIIAFTIKATGEEAALVSALERLRKSPYEQRVKELVVERIDTGYGPGAGKRLKITSMIVEVLLVAGTQNKMGLHPGVDPQFYLYNHIAARNGAAPAGWGLWASTVAIIAAAQEERKVAGVAPPEPRQYDDIARRNIFVGAIPVPPPPPKSGGTETDIEKTPTGPGATPPPENVPAYVRLVHTVPSQQEAFLRNLVYGGREIKLIAKPGSGFDTFKITDEDRVFVFFTAKILAVEGRDIYFQVRDQVYKQHINQSLAEAMRTPLSYLEVLDLDLYDKEWAKEQIGDSKKKPDTGKKKKGGR